jgi:hypothetical protein
MTAMLEGIVTEVKAVPANTPSPILVILVGIVTAVSALQ